MTNKKSDLLQYSGLFLVAVIWGSTFMLAKESLNYIGTFTLLLLRFLTAGISLLIFRFKRYVKQEKKELIRGVVLGVFLFSGYFFQTEGLRFTSASKQAFITGSYVVILPFLYALYKRGGVNKRDLVSGLFCFFGIAVISGFNFKDLGNFSFNQGDALTLISAFFYANHLIFCGTFNSENDSYNLTVTQLLTVGLLSLPGYLIFPDGADKIVKATPSLLYLTFVATLLGYLLQNICQKNTEPAKASIILSLETLFGGIFAIIFLKEALSLSFIVGAALVFLSIILINIRTVSVEVEKDEE